MKRILPYALLCFIGVPLHAAAPPKSQSPFSVTVRLDRAAIWVGDSLQYTIEVIHPRSLQFALENLKKENLALAPFVLRQIRVEERPWRDDQKLLEVVLLLTTYESDKAELQIPPLALYYFRRESGLSEKEARAQPLRIPPQRVALRSTLPGGPARLREFKPMEEMPPVRPVAALVVGLMGIGSIGSYAGLRLWRTLRRDRAVKRPSGRRARARQSSEALRRIRELPHNSPEELEAVYAESGQFLRAYLTQWLDVELRGLTPGEAEETLRKAGRNGDFARQVRSVLEQCEDGRYRNPNERAAHENRFESVVDGLERAIKMAAREK